MPQKRTAVTPHSEEASPRENIGLDVHKRETQVCVLTAAGEVREERLPTSRERLVARFAPQEPSRILLEASTESE